MSQAAGEEWLHSPEKRLYDITFAATVMPVVAPLSAVALSSVALLDRVNPLFLQERVGQELETITVPKVRTLPGVNERGSGHIGHDDPRASRIGRILRRTHLDELPQGFLVLKGDMSLVGPRPISWADYEETMDELSSTEQIDWKYARTVCKPGATMNYNVWQHTGESILTPHNRAAADIDYAFTASRRKDFKIILDNFVATGADFLGLDIEAQPGHPQTIQGLKHIATHFGVIVNESDEAYWRAMLNLARAVDIHLDEEGNQDVPDLFATLLAGEPIEHMTAEECEEFKKVYYAQTPEKQAQILKGTSIVAFALELKTAIRLSDIVAARVAEAEVFGRIISLPEHGAFPDNSARKRFNSWLVQFSRAGYLIDSLIDYSDDFQNGELSLEPSLLSRLTLGREVCRELMVCYRDLPKKALPSMFMDGVNKAIRGKTKRLDSYADLL